MSSLPNPLTGQNAQNPLGWPGQTGTNMPPSTTSVPGAPSLFGTPVSPVSVPSAAGTPGSQNPFGQGSRGGGDQTYNLAETNLQSGLLKNFLASPFAQRMFGNADQATQFFKTLMNLGSPYYKEQQRSSLEAGVNAAQNTAAGSKARLNAAGYGAAPSGLEAATIGEEATGEATNLAQTFLQNLFQNENLQLSGAQGLTGIAQLFNPSPLLTGTNPNIQQPTNTAAETISGVGSLIGGLFGTSGVPR